MQKKNFKTNRFTLAFTLLFIISPLLFNCGGGGGDGGDGAVDTGPFEMAAYFPLSSGWQTDKWTLIVSEVDYDINGVATKVMADTDGPGLYFWTNDENGWRMHAFMDEYGYIETFDDTPLLFTNSTCSVGDKTEGTLILYGEEFDYTLELAGVETVSVPAGTFRNCLKFVLHIWLASDLPVYYGYETFWLAEDVGFVKGMSDEDVEIDLFTASGETRRLLSYHTTPSDRTADEVAILQAGGKMTDYLEAGDLDNAMAMVSDDYFDRNCMDKARLEENWYGLINSSSNRMWISTAEDVSVNGDYAYLLAERLFFRIMNGTGEPVWFWERRTSRWRKESGEWKFYGSQLGFRTAWVDVWIRNDDGNFYNPIDGEFTKCGDGTYIDSPDVISSLTVTGPPGSGITNLDMLPCWLGNTYPTERYFWCDDQLQNAVSGFYSFRVENQSGDYLVITDYLEATPAMNLPAHVSPADEAEDVSPDNVLFDWNPVEAEVSYRLDLQLCTDGSCQYAAGFPVGNLSNSQFTVSLAPNSAYRWRVRAQLNDLYGNMDNESRTGWSYFTTSGG